MSIPLEQCECAHACHWSNFIDRNIQENLLSLLFVFSAGIDVCVVGLHTEVVRYVYLAVQPYDTVAEVKRKMEAKGYDAYDQALWFNGTLLEEDVTLMAYDIKEGSFIEQRERPILADPFSAGESVLLKLENVFASSYRQPFRNVL